MKTKYDQVVAFYDSGVGGLPYLEVAKRLLPAERYVYLADRDGFPYGTKSREQVVDLALSAVDALIRTHRPKAVAVACNTASAAALQELRRAFPETPIIGTVPAVKPAAASSRLRRIGVIATARAAEDPYVLDLIARWAPDCFVARRGDQGLVDFVENHLFSATPGERLEAVRPSVQFMLDAGVDAIVLACTHFLYLASEFAQVAGPGVRIVDSRDGVVAQLRRVLLAGPGINRSRPEGPDLMYLTGPEPFGPKYESFAASFGLEPAGS
ncbi:MAG: glutamate racemase, partial [Spirochaetales bacterium]